MDQSKKDAIVAKVEELFAQEQPEVIEFREKGFSVEFRYHDTSFEDLKKISKAFGTKNINMGTERRGGGWCETCYYSYTVNIVRVDDISEEWL